ncbi:NAD-binding protein [Winogradskyella maritima]|nr:NAD-binding protein [Winogradskyella maritima]
MIFLIKGTTQKLVFIGAGYIGMEFAHMAARAGSKVTIIDSEKELSNLLMPI